MATPRVGHVLTAGSNPGREDFMRFLLKVSIPTEAGSFALEGCRVRISREGRDSAWDSFVARCPGGHHEQTSLWGEVKGVYGWQSFRIVVTRENEILGGVRSEEHTSELQSLRHLVC